MCILIFIIHFISYVSMYKIHLCVIYINFTKHDTDEIDISISSQSDDRNTLQHSVLQRVAVITRWNEIDISISSVSYIDEYSLLYISIYIHLHCSSSNISCVSYIHKYSLMYIYIYVHKCTLIFIRNFICILILHRWIFTMYVHIYMYIHVHIRLHISHSVSNPSTRQK